MIDYQTIQTMQKRNLTFPEYVVGLRALDIERIYVDLVRMEKIYYGKDGDSYLERFPLTDTPLPGEIFEDNKVVEVLRTHQRGETDYHEFVREIVRHGTTNYVVYLTGRKVVYSGCNGDSYTESFTF